MSSPTRPPPPADVKVTDAPGLKNVYSPRLFWPVKANAGKWSLIVTPPGQTPREFKDLPYARQDFRKLTWVGSSSNATVKTSFFLDNVKLRTK